MYELKTINAEGRANLIEFLQRFMSEPQHAETTADHLINNWDPVRPHVELRGMYAADGNPVIYTWADFEIDTEMVED